MIRGIIEQTGVKIDVSDDGSIQIAAIDEAAANKAMQMIGDITAVAEVGKTYRGKVVRLVDFGAFVEIFPGTAGLQLRVIDAKAVRDRGLQVVDMNRVLDDVAAEIIRFADHLPALYAATS